MKIFIIVFITSLLLSWGGWLFMNPKEKENYLQVFDEFAPIKGAFMYALVASILWWIF